MAFPTSDWPGAIDATETRVDLSDVVYADDFSYLDSRIVDLQSMLGDGVGQIIGQLVASNEGPGGLASPVADGGIAVKLAAKNIFTSGDILQILDGGIAGTVKAKLNYAGLLWALAGVDASNSLIIPYGAAPVAGTQGRLLWDTNILGLAVDNGSAWEPVGPYVRPVSSEPTGRSVKDTYLDDGTNTVSGNPGWRYLVSTGPDVWADV